MYFFEITLRGDFGPPTGALMNSTGGLVATTVPLPFANFGIFTGVFAHF